MTYYIVEIWEEDTYSYNSPWHLEDYKLFDSKVKAKDFVRKQNKSPDINYNIREIELNVD